MAFRTFDLHSYPREKVQLLIIQVDDVEKSLRAVFQTQHDKLKDSLKIKNGPVRGGVDDRGQPGDQKDWFCQREHYARATWQGTIFQIRTLARYCRPPSPPLPYLKIGHFRTAGHVMGPAAHSGDPITASDSEVLPDHELFKLSSFANVCSRLKL